MKAHEPVARVRRPATSVLDGIGDTPLVRLENIVTLFCDEGEKYISEHIFRTEGGGRGD